MLCWDSGQISVPPICVRRSAADFRIDSSVLRAPPHWPERAGKDVTVALAASSMGLPEVAGARPLFAPLGPALGLSLVNSPSGSHGKLTNDSRAIFRYFLEGSDISVGLQVSQGWAGC